MTPAIVTVVEHHRKGFVQVGHQYGMLMLRLNDRLKCLVYLPSIGRSHRSAGVE